MGNLFAYINLIKMAIPLIMEATAAIQAALPDSPGTAKLQYVLIVVQQGLHLLEGTVANVDQLTPLINAAVAMHKVAGTAGFTATPAA
jgi:hypothetical protein